jgi:hypothetical protein
MYAVRSGCSGFPAVHGGPRDPQNVGEVLQRESESLSNLSHTGWCYVCQSRPPSLTLRMLDGRAGRPGRAAPRVRANPLEMKADLSCYRPRRYVVRAAKRG